MSIRILLAIVLLGAVLSACSSSSSTQEETPEDVSVDAQTVLSDAADAVADLETFHFRLDHENGSSSLPLGLELVSAEGDVAVPDRLKAEVKAKSGPLTIDVDVVGAEGKTWITNPFSGRFEELPGTDLAEITDPHALAGVVTRELQDAKIASTERIDGVEAYRLTGTVDTGALESVLQGEPGNEVDVEVWIGREDNLPRRVRISGPIAGSDDEDVVRRIEFSRFNEPVDITAPR